MINVLFCQIYSVILQNLTLIKKIVIERVYFVISILKFRSHNFDTVTFYQRIREHAIIFFKIQIYFWKFLSSISLIVHDVIRII